MDNNPFLPYQFTEQQQSISSEEILDGLGDLGRLDDRLKEILQEFPEKRRELHEQLAEMAKQEVDSNIDASLGGDTGKVTGWQETHVGSGGGYAAVRPTNATTGKNSPGAVTNYLENGHRIRPPSGSAKHYQPRINTPRVEGRQFYEKTRSSIQAKALDLVERFVDQITERMNEA